MCVSMTRRFATVLAISVLAAASRAQDHPIDRTMLPIAEPDYPHSTVLDARDAKPPPRFEVKAPAGAPNVLIVLVDDMGFGMPSAFGGPVRMPTADRLASQGLRYNQFHTTALCSPTRTALLSGRNHHMNNMGGITEIATAFPGQHRAAPEQRRAARGDAAAERLQHRLLRQEPRDGGVGGQPLRADRPLADALGLRQVLRLHRRRDRPVGAQPLRRPDPRRDAALPRLQLHDRHDRPGDRLDEVPEGAHAGQAVLHVLRAGRDARAASRAQGVDRQEQGPVRRRLGQDARRDARAPDRAGRRARRAPSSRRKPEAIKDWDKLTADEKKLFARQMEVYAGFGEYCDHEIGRLFDAIGETGQLDNTLIFYIIGDNGTSAEGGMFGMFNEMTYFNGVQETVQEMLKHYDEWGGPATYPHMAAGWAVAGDTPFMWTKQIPSNYGGTRNGMIVSWPKRIKATNQVRSQWHHVIDVAPTVLEAAQPARAQERQRHRPGADRRREHGLHLRQARTRRARTRPSISRSWAIAPSTSDGWFAGTIHRAPWEQKPRRKLQEDIWELYDTRNDFSLANDLAASNPAKLKELQDLFMKEAIKYRVLPIDDRVLERVNAASRRPARPDGRPHLAHALRGHGGHERERVHQHQEPVVLDHRGRGDSRRAARTA